MSIFNANTSGKLGVDTSKDTVTADKLLKGVTAHDKNGKLITGTHVCEQETFQRTHSFISVAGAPVSTFVVK